MARKGVAPKGKSRSAGTAPTRHRQLVFGDSRRALVFQPSAQRKPAMRTAADFNLYYAAPDPWHISHARFRDSPMTTWHYSETRDGLLEDRGGRPSFGRGRFSLAGRGFTA